MSEEPRGGRLLIATISLLDPNFGRTVVLLCEHRSDQGSYGLVLNRPIEVPAEVHERLPFVEGCLYQGGPVRPDTLQVLHPYGEAVPGAVEVLPGVYLGGDFETLCDCVGSGSVDPAKCRFFLGYSGWGEEQLDHECHDGSWLVAPADAGLVWDTPSEHLWSEAVRRSGHTDPIYCHYPEDPSWN